MAKPSPPASNSEKGVVRRETSEHTKSHQGARPVRDWHKLLEPMVEAARDSERLSASDFAIRINTRD